MGVQFGDSLDLNGHEILHGLLEKLAASPAYVATDESRVIYNTATNLPEIADDTQYRALLLSGLIVLSDFAANVVDTDGTLAANDDNRLATQRAAKTYIDAAIAAADFWEDQGTIDASGNPNYPAADKGHLWRIDTAGKIGGAAGIDVLPGDLIIALNDGVAAGDEATVGAQWMVRKAPTTAAAATDIAAGIVELATTGEAVAGTDTTRAVTPAGLAAALAAALTAAAITALVNSATETAEGKAEIATQAEVTAGTDDARFVTPLKLAQRLQNVGRYVGTITASTGATIAAATHALGAGRKHVTIYQGDNELAVTVSCNAAGDVTWSSGVAVTGEIIIS